jgi:hypothetical protein
MFPLTAPEKVILKTDFVPATGVNPVIVEAQGVDFEPVVVGQAVFTGVILVPLLEVGLVPTRGAVEAAGGC